MQVISQPYNVEPDTPLAAPTLAHLRSEFQALHARAPLRAIKLFFYYLNARGVDSTVHEMAFWATSGTLYISVLLDHDVLNQESLPAAMAENTMALLPLVDNQFLIKMARSMAALTDAAAILHALRYVPALGDYSILIPWLRSLEEHVDSRIRSRSAKLICHLRPSNGTIQRHLQSRDARIRASVIEALWNPKVNRLDETVLSLLRSGVTDPNHRVVANALVGLYRLGESEALQKMIILCSTRQHLLRAAMAWAMGVVDDSRAVPSLQRLLHDPSFTVRKRANSSLVALGYATEEAVETQRLAIESTSEPRGVSKPVSGFPIPSSYLLTPIPVVT